VEKGIDVSRYQGWIDWPAVKAAGFTFAIVRAGYGRLASQQDPEFARNCRQAKAAGLALGCYWFSYAPDAAAAKAEAEACLAVLGKETFPLGVWFDQEYVAPILAASRARRTEAVQAFLAEMEKAGRTAGLYCSADWLKNRVYTAQLAGENLWIAEYAAQCTSPLAPCLWQHTSTGGVPGIRGNVDCDLLYRMPACPAEKSGAAAEANAPLCFGSTGPRVKLLQKQLEKLGFSVGSTDGIFGKKTRAAVKAFQRKASLAADGIAGPKTCAALAAACA
jgi:GH25 family lysozyme M1 (1,4-beta-N-acetylmuramidase)